MDNPDALLSPAPPSAAETQARLLDSLLNVSGDFIFVIAPDGRYLYVSATAARTLGRTPAQVVGQSAETLGVPGSLTAWMAEQRAQVLATGRALSGDFHYPNAAGEIRNYVYRYTPLLTPDESVEAVLCTAQDVTEQRRAEAEAAEAVARLNAAYERDHAIAATLQRSLLQMPPPDAFPGLEIASRYRSATADMEIGGDFIDAFPVDPTRVALVVGDVAGKGLAAAARIAEAKFTLRSYLREYPSTAIGLKRLNSYLYDTAQWGGQSPEGFVCLSLAIFDSATGEVTASVAGEDTPLLLRGNGQMETLPVNGMALGIAPDTDYTAMTTRMEAGDTLALVTDGIMEAQAGDTQWGMDGLQQSLAGLPPETPTASLAERILADARAFGGGTLRDDAAVLLARRVR